MTSDELPVLEVNSVSKKFSLDLKSALRYGARDLGSELMRHRGRRRWRLRPTEFWAVREADFRLHRGESIGILGLNGAGKSTLLRLIAGLTRPDEGNIVVRGRVGVLLDPMGGFNPVLTGRENVAASAALFGIDRLVFEDRLAEIIEFADIGAFIDSPVRIYSRGMRMRLAFAVAAHLEPDLLLIDEALAVGDVGFQRKCYELLRQFCADGGSLAVVSHSVLAVESLCTSAVLLDHGHQISHGSATEIVRTYTRLIAERELQSAADAVVEEASTGVESASQDAVPVGVASVAAADPDEGEPDGTGSHESADVGSTENEPAGDVSGAIPIVSMGRPVAFTSVEFGPVDGAPIRTGSVVRLRAGYRSSEAIEGVDWGFALFSADGMVALAAEVTEEPADRIDLHRGEGLLCADIPDFPLMPGSYMLRMALIENSTTVVVGLHGFDTVGTYFEVAPDGAPARVPSWVSLGEFESGTGPLST